ncbi:non-ribosomal peptide synthase, dehydrogenase domain-containing protein [Halovivax ruber XH-70]|uniref:Non-ribosomal peptide synthase, dehydrogenase domain-containing protein n=1 Tax=Halovivax ruber (strain DSM 18193 / JCM 13892 / XH-70) TaxID=797302 RepID=L0IFG8_HALRX|nr:SDR family oxidoreductase [Halovivax ruber]AGB16717.1 non-ribosomal peptide synthase, dehydrogenase domain-containing protein [Halovivax ruber XH-70]
MVVVSDPAVFVTGFPGFLGSALVERLLARGDGPIACLVQPHHAEAARDRADEIVAEIDGVGNNEDTAGDDGGDADAIRLYEGDITDPDLGLGDAVDDLASVSEVYHLAAVYDLGVEAALAEAVNVRGTEHVLSFAESLDVERFHYVSTCYVSGRYDGVFTPDHLQEGQSFNNHYEETKYRAEVAVQERMAEGFPATIYRPAIVVGDSRTGETEKFDGPYNLVRLLLAQPRWFSATFSLPNSSDAELNVVPRDFVVDAIAHLSAREDAVGEVYQLCDPAPLSVPRFVDTLAAATGHRTVRLPTPKSVAVGAMEAVGRLGIDTDPYTLDYLDHPTRYACPNTTRALADSDISVPPFESYADRLVTFVREHPDIRDEPMI